MIGVAVTAPSEAKIELDPAIVWKAPEPLSMDMAGLPVLHIDNPVLSKWVRDRLNDYELYPAACQKRLDLARQAAQVQLDIALSQDDITDSERSAKLQDEINKMWPTWQVVAMVAGSVLFGGGVMWLAMAVAPR